MSRCPGWSGLLLLAFLPVACAPLHSGRSEVAASYPPLPQTDRQLAALCDRQGDNARAEAVYLRAVEGSPRDADLLSEVAHFYYTHNRYADAEKWLRQVTEISPADQRTWVNLGLALAHQGRPVEGLEIFTRVLGPAQAQGTVGLLLEQEGKLEEARKALRQALFLDPTLTQVREALARLDGLCDHPRAFPPVADEASLVLSVPMPGARAPAPPATTRSPGQIETACGTFPLETVPCWRAVGANR